MNGSSNSLFQKDLNPVPGWSVLAFLVVGLAIGGGAIWLLPDRSMVPLLTTFFGTGLAAVLLAVSPMGLEAAIQALALRRVGLSQVLLAVVGTTVLSFIVSQLGPQPEGVRQITDAVHNPSVLMPTFLVLAVLAPLVEELVFRGLLYGWIAGRWGPLPAFVASSLAFAAAHGEPAHIVLVLPLGFWFGWLRWRTNSLVPTIAAHMINNGFAVLGAAWLGS